LHDYRENLYFFICYVCFWFCWILYLGGNQRDLARERAAKRDSKGTKQSETDANKGLSLEERKHRDAERMRLKQQQAQEKKPDEKA
jgi:hypothetical protein